MKKIILIPLDERPCNYHFTKQLSLGTDYEVVLPPVEMMGQKKKAANIEKIWKWLKEQVIDAYGAILSMDMLIYGGIIPSRLHDYTNEELEKRCNGIKELKSINSNLKVYAFNLIMRAPQYSSSDEEPDYYEDWGREIFRYGYINHKVELNVVTEDEKRELESINDKLPKEYLNDYLGRRSKNILTNQYTIDLLKDGFIDFVIIPQDDAAPYGLTAKDQELVRKYIRKQKMGLKVYMYPGADEVENTLLARMINEDNVKKPLVYVKFNSSLGHQVIPLYEDRIVSESIKYQIMAAGGMLATSVSEADIVLLINTPSDTMLNSSQAHLRGIEYNVMRGLIEMVEYTDYCINTLNKPVVIGDIAYGNGSDLELIELLAQKGLLFKLAGYAGWNTSSNTLGTCIPQGMIYWHDKERSSHLDFLALRYVEDAGYCAVVRQKVTAELKNYGFNYFGVDGQRGKVSQIVKDELESFINEYLIDTSYEIKIEDCYMPWSRMFEVGLDVKAVKK